MLVYLKKYYLFMLILLVFSYLVPKEEYKKYMQFFIGAFMVVLFLKPILELLYMDGAAQIYNMFDSFNHQIEQLDLKIEEGETIYEFFFLQGKGA